MIHLEIDLVWNKYNMIIRSHMAMNTLIQLYTFWTISPQFMSVSIQEAWQYHVQSTELKFFVSIQIDSGWIDVKFFLDRADMEILSQTNTKNSLDRDRIELEQHEKLLASRTTQVQEVWYRFRSKKFMSIDPAQVFHVDPAQVDFAPRSFPCRSSSIRTRSRMLFMIVDHKFFISIHLDPRSLRPTSIQEVHVDPAQVDLDPRISERSLMSISSFSSRSKSRVDPRSLRSRHPRSSCRSSSSRSETPENSKISIHSRIGLKFLS